MRRQFRSATAFVLLAVLGVTGCHPSQPFYLHEDGDLSHFVQVATEMDEPDLDTERLEEVAQAKRPLTISDSENFAFWDLELEDCIAIALQNSKVIKNLGSVRTPIDQQAQAPLPEQLLTRPEAVPTIYDPAIFESDPQTGVEAALSDFDAQFTTQAFWQRTDRPQNINPAQFAFVPLVLQQDLGQLDIQFQKKTATGSVFALRSQTIYDHNNRGFGRNLVSDYFQAFEAEARIPLSRGRGTMINRLPVILSRMRTDVTLAEFEVAVRDLVRDVEHTYWNLSFAYRELAANKKGRDSTLGLWRTADVKRAAGAESAQVAEQAAQQYFDFRSRVEQSVRNLFANENNLRFLMGLSPTDGRLIRPIDEPSTARLEFNWDEVHAESLVRSADLRRQKWLIKQRELQLIAARNQLLPQINATLLHRWLGLGDHLGLGQERTGINFPTAGSQAFDVLTEGDFQEERIGIEFVPPKFGARRELASVRNAQLEIARAKARYEEMELNLAHVMTQSIRDLDTQYILAQTRMNQMNAAENNVDLAEELQKNGKGTADLVLEAQRFQVEAEIQYFRAVTNYNKAICDVHFRKGSLLEYNGVQLAEGPWPKKAYWDALGHARERDASYYLNYGWTRPKVMSRGATLQEHGFTEGTKGATPEAASTPEAMQPGMDGMMMEPAELKGEPEPAPAAPGPTTLRQPARLPRASMTIGSGVNQVNPLRTGESETAPASYYGTE